MNFIREFAADLISNTVVKRLAYEARENIKSNSHKGESKSEAKKEAKAAGTTFSGTYSSMSEDEYEKKGGFIISKVIERYPDQIKHVRDCIPFIKEVLESLYDSKTQASTIRTYMYAVAACLGVKDYHQFGFKSLAKRNVHQNTRTRSQSNSDAKLVGEEYDNLREFIEAVGARRGGLMHLCENDFFVDSNGDFRVHLLEKGGKERDALVLPENADFVRSFFENPQGNISPNGERYVFGKKDIPKNFTCHSHRAAYAVRLYKFFKSNGMHISNTNYRCRKERYGDVFDRGILLAVSRELGHNRLDVAAQNYLYDLHLSEVECR